MILATFLLIVSGFSDWIHLVDGTKIQGTIVHTDETHLEISLKAGGTIRLARETIARVELAQVPAVDPAPQRPVHQQPVQPLPLGQPLPFGQPAPLSYANPLWSPAVGLDLYGVDMEMVARQRLLMYNDRRKDPWMAVGLGMIFSSTGHLYTEEWLRGLFFLGTRSLFAGLGLWGFQTRLNDDDEPVFVNPMVGSVGLGGFALFTVLEGVDAFFSAERYNRTLRIRLGIDDVRHIW